MSLIEELLFCCRRSLGDSEWS